MFLKQGKMEMGLIKTYGSQQRHDSQAGISAAGECQQPTPHQKTQEEL